LYKRKGSPFSGTRKQVACGGTETPDGHGVVELGRTPWLVKGKRRERGQKNRSRERLDFANENNSGGGST